MSSTRRKVDSPVVYRPCGAGSFTWRSVVAAFEDAARAGAAVGTTKPTAATAASDAAVRREARMGSPVNRGVAMSGRPRSSQRVSGPRHGATYRFRGADSHPAVGRLTG